MNRANLVCRTAKLTSKTTKSRVAYLIAVGGSGNVCFGVSVGVGVNGNGNSIGGVGVSVSIIPLSVTVCCLQWL